MNETIKLAEQHILESQLRLRHIDEMMAQAKASDAAHLAAQLEDIQHKRDGAEQELHDIHSLGSTDSDHLVKRSEKVKTVLESVGDQLERVLGSIIGQGGR